MAALLSLRGVSIARKGAYYTFRQCLDAGGHIVSDSEALSLGYESVSEYDAAVNIGRGRRRG